MLAAWAATSARDAVVALDVGPLGALVVVVINGAVGRCLGVGRGNFGQCRLHYRYLIPSQALYVGQSNSPAISCTVQT
jgi:hypothetical protein